MQLYSQLTPNYIAPSAWWEHVPIAHWLIARLKPQTVVELGTHYGVSFFAFCQASKQFETGSFIYAVDTWAGDEHAGLYGNDVYNQVLTHQRAHYGQISSLLRQSFDEAAAYFGDESVDLLHIDGLHTYEAVRHDHEVWLPKLCQEATILFHDINVREREFGVWELWRQLKEDPLFSCLEVRNGSGLGIATLTAEPPDWHHEFKERQGLFQSSGALYLELAVKHLSLQQSQSDNAELNAELVGLRQQVEAAARAKEEEAEAKGEDTESNQVAAQLPQELPSGRTRIRRSLSRQRHLLQNIAYRVARKAGIAHANSPDNLTPDSQLRIICISGEPQTPGHRYRVIRLADSFRAIGARVTLIEEREIVSHLSMIERCNILSLWRIGWSADLDVAIKSCQRNGGKVLFDVDDLMIRPELAKATIIDGIRSNRFDEEKTAGLFARMQQTMLASDLCLTTTQELAAQMQLYGMPVMILPNGYDEETYSNSRLAFRIKQQTDRSDIIRIGYASGSLTHQKDFECCCDALARILLRNKHCRLVLFQDASHSPCLDIREFPSLEAVSDQIEWRQLVPIELLPHELARFDINLIPLETDNVFTEAKSELKFFEAALVGTCSIASPTGPFRRIIRHGETGFLASSEQEWEDQLQCLISNPELRHKFSTGALDDILFAHGPVSRTQQISRLAAYAVNPSLRPLVFQAIIQEEVSQQPAVTIDLPDHDIVLVRDRLKPSSTSIVIPLYNYGQYIEKTLDSVKDQSLANVDLIVVNDKSTDDSLAKARDWLERNHQHFNRIVLVSNRVNSKLGPSRNVGFHLAETDYVFTLDADNLLAPRCLELCLAAARRSKAAYIYPTLQEFGASKGRIGDIEYTPMKLVSGNYIDAMAMVSKAAWLRVGGYQNIRHGWEDYDFWCRIAEAGLNAHSLQGAPLAYYRVHQQSMLRTTTDGAENKKALINHLESLHPWLHISTPPEDKEGTKSPGVATAPEASPEPAAQPSAATKQITSGKTSRLASLLPILRCPSSHRPLVLCGEGLQAQGDPEMNWPLLCGVPNLFAGLTSPEVRDEGHISHPLPSHLLDRIKATSGRVLNLSAGGSAEKIDNIIEVEFALFRNTDVIADAHGLPFVDECFDGIISMNAFEHYHNPCQVAAELLRVLKPGGWLVVQTAFLQPKHEYPWHFYNTTSEGMKLWFKQFNIDEVRISENFNPLFALSWLAAECESAIRSDVSVEAADKLNRTSLKVLIDHWKSNNTRHCDLWESFSRLSQGRQRPIAAGFELIATKPFDRGRSS